MNKFTPIIRVRQYPLDCIMKVLNDNDVPWSVSLLPRYLYEVFDKHETTMFKIMLSGKYELSRPMIYVGTLELDDDNMAIFKKYKHSLRDPMTGIETFDGYHKEILSNPIERMFYMEKSSTCNGVDVSLCCRCWINDIFIKNNMVK